MKSKILVSIFFALVLIGMLSFVVSAQDGASTEVSIDDDLNLDNLFSEGVLVEKQVDFFKGIGIDLDKSQTTGFAGEAEKDGSGFKSTLSGEKVGENGLKITGLTEGKSLEFDTEKVKSYCSELGKKEGETCAKLTKEGLEFTNGAVYRNGKIEFPGQGRAVLSGKSGSSAEADLSKVNPKDFASLKNFQIKGEGSVVKDHLGNTYKDTDFTLDKVGANGALKITATTPVTIDYKEGRFGILQTGQMTMQPSVETGTTGMRTMDTDATQFTFQGGTPESPINLATYTGKGAIFYSPTPDDSIDTLFANYNGAEGPAFVPKAVFGDGPTEFFMTKTFKGQEVKLDGVNSNHGFYADVSNGGSLQWRTDSKGAYNYFKVTSTGFFVKPASSSPAQVQSASSSYTVTEDDKRGVWGIADKDLRDRGINSPTDEQINNRMDEILKANNMEGSEVLQPGQVLEIPPYSQGVQEVVVDLANPVEVVINSDSVEGLDGDAVKNEVIVSPFEKRAKDEGFVFSDEGEVTFSLREGDIPIEFGTNWREIEVEVSPGNWKKYGDLTSEERIALKVGTQMRAEIEVEVSPGNWKNYKDLTSEERAGLTENTNAQIVKKN